MCWKAFEMQSVCECSGYFYFHLSAWDVGIASVKLIALIRLHVECESHFLFCETIIVCPEFQLYCQIQDYLYENSGQVVIARVVLPRRFT